MGIIPKIVWDSRNPSFTNGIIKNSIEEVLLEAVSYFGAFGAKFWG